VAIYIIGDILLAASFHVDSLAWLGRCSGGFASGLLMQATYMEVRGRIGVALGARCWFLLRVVDLRLVDCK